MRECTGPYGKKIMAHEADDLGEESLLHHVEKAKEMWRALCREHYEANGDAGCCTLGAGLWLWVVSPGKRKAKRQMLIMAHEVAACQGEANWACTYPPVRDYLWQQGIEVEYDGGRMD